MTHLAQSQTLSRQDMIDAVGGFVVFGFAMVVALAIWITVCALLSGALRRVPAPYRKMEPGLVWLMLIPLFNMVWVFFVFLRIPESFQAYFNAQGRTDVGDCGRGLGLAFATVWVVSAVGSCIPILGCIFSLGGLASLVLLIIYLVKIMGLKAMIPEGAYAPPPITMR